MTEFPRPFRRIAAAILLLFTLAAASAHAHTEYPLDVAARVSTAIAPNPVAVSAKTLTSLAATAGKPTENVEGTLIGPQWGWSVKTVEVAATAAGPYDVAAADSYSADLTDPSDADAALEFTPTVAGHWRLTLSVWGGYIDSLGNTWGDIAETEVKVTSVGVASLQYKQGASFVDVPSPLYVLKGTTVTFKPISKPEGATWPTGKPVWGGTAGATGTGTTKDVTFSQKGNQTVTVECGNSVMAAVVVFELAGAHMAQDWFDGRSTTEYGVAEVANLFFVTDPSVTATQIGGLAWSIGSGSGSISSGGTDGTGTYTAPDVPSQVTLRLTVLTGPSAGGHAEVAFDVVAPSGTRMTRVNSNVWHVQDTASAGIKLYYWLEPKTVSFKNVAFGEDAVPPSAVGGFYTRCEPWNSYPNGTTVRDHAQNTFGAVLAGNANTGCRVSVPDYASTGFALPYAAGTFTWSIPAQYIAGGVRRTFGNAQDQVSTYWDNGNAQADKGGQTSGQVWLNAWTSSGE